MSFLKLPRSKQFNIGTRFYDPQKEAMKERQERIKRELGQENPDGETFHYSAGIKGQFRKSINRNSKTVADARKKSNIRLVSIIILLSILFYILLK